jgi:hypothetical protein
MIASIEWFASLPRLTRVLWFVAAYFAVLLVTNALTA